MTAGTWTRLWQWLHSCVNSPPLTHLRCARSVTCKWDLRQAVLRTLLRPGSILTVYAFGEYLLRMSPQKGSWTPILLLYLSSTWTAVGRTGKAFPGEDKTLTAGFQGWPVWPGLGNRSCRRREARPFLREAPLPQALSLVLISGFAWFSVQDNFVYASVLFTLWILSGGNHFGDTEKVEFCQAGNFGNCYFGSFQVQVVWIHPVTQAVDFSLVFSIPFLFLSTVSDLSGK